MTVTEASGSFFRFVAHARAPETSTSKLPPLLRGWERPSLYRGPHSRSSHPARVTDSLDSSRNERIHRRHLRHRYVTRVARPHRGRVASSPRRALGALRLPDRICSLSSGFYSFSVGASRARFARYLGHPRPSPRRRWIRCSRHDIESNARSHPRRAPRAVLERSFLNRCLMISNRKSRARHRRGCEISPPTASTPPRIFPPA